MTMPQTEYQAQQQNQAVAVNAQAAISVPLQSTPASINAAYYTDPYNPDLWKKAEEARQKDAFTPPSNAEIEKEMWIGSFMSALMVGLATGDPAGAIAGGLWGAIAIHDYGYQLQQRAGDVPGLQKAGYSMPAIRKYYDDGDTSGLDKERDDMLAGAKFAQQQKEDDRDYARRVERDKVSDMHWQENNADRDRNYASSQQLRREAQDLREQGYQLRSDKFEWEKGQAQNKLDREAESRRVSNLPPLDQARYIIQNHKLPSGDKATAADMKAAQGALDGNRAYTSNRKALLESLAPADELIKNLKSGNDDGIGPLAGHVNLGIYNVLGEEVAARNHNLIAQLKSGIFTNAAANMKGVMTETDAKKVEEAYGKIQPDALPSVLAKQINDFRKAVMTGIQNADADAINMGYDTQPAIANANYREGDVSLNSPGQNANAVQNMQMGETRTATLPNGKPVTFTKTGNN